MRKAICENLRYLRAIISPADTLMYSDRNQSLCNHCDFEKKTLITETTREDARERREEIKSYKSAIVILKQTIF